MDEGAQPTWQDRYNVDEISAVQYAMNLKFRDEGAFASEYQNAPVVESLEATEFDATGGCGAIGLQTRPKSRRKVSSLRLYRRS